MKLFPGVRQLSGIGADVVTRLNRIHALVERQWRATGPLLFVSDTVGYVMRMDKLETMGRKDVEMSL